VGQSASVPTPKDFVLYSNVGWDFLWQRPQQMAWHMSQHHPVAYIDWPPAVLGQAVIHSKARKAVGRALRPPAEPRPDLFRVKPFVPLGNRRYANWRPIRQVNAASVRSSVRRACRRLGFEHPILWAYFSPFLLEYCGDDLPLLYECVDDQRLFAAPGRPADEVVRRERAIATRATWVTATARHLCDRVESVYGVACHYLPNGCEYDHFRQALRPLPAPDDLEPIPGPRVGYVGAVAYWLNLDLIAEVAALRPEMSFVFVGPVIGDKVEERLAGIANVHLLGEKHYADLPRYLAHFDVCTIPFKLDEFMRSVNPIKFYEYLAADRPVVAAPLPELLPHAAVARFAEDPSDFAQAIDASLAEPRDARSEARQRVAQANTWDARCQRVLDIVEGNA